MKSLHPSPPLDQSETDLGIVNESQLLRFGINWKLEVGQSQSLPRLRTQKQKGHIIVLRNAMLRIEDMASIGLY